jgi:hypothetical protein
MSSEQSARPLTEGDYSEPVVFVGHRLVESFGEHQQPFLGSV